MNRTTPYILLFLLLVCAVDGRSKSKQPAQAVAATSFNKQGNLNRPIVFVNHGRCNADSLEAQNLEEKASEDWPKYETDIIEGFDAFYTKRDECIARLAKKLNAIACFIEYCPYIDSYFDITDQVVAELNDNYLEGNQDV